LTSPCELSERKVTSPSNLKVVGALDNYSLGFVIFITFIGLVLFLVSCPKGQVEKYVIVEAWHRSQNVWHVHLENCKKKSLNIHSRVRPNTQELEGVGSQIYRIFLWSESDILGGILSDLRVWALIHLECTVCWILSEMKISCLYLVQKNKVKSSTITNVLTLVTVCGMCESRRMKHVTWW
jgi:hypothetical protein